MKINRNRSIVESADQEISDQMRRMHDPSKRTFLRLAGTGAAGLALGGVIAPVSRPGTPEPACNKPTIALEVSTGIAFFNKVAALLPGKAQIIAKIVGALNDFNTDYQRGDFNSAGTIFSTIDADATQLIADVGVNVSPSIKIALALADAAISAIAVLLKSQSNAPGVPAKSAMNVHQQAQVSVVERRAMKAEKLFEAIKQ